MPYREVQGDLFEGGYPAIGHGVNLAGLMGAGIAKVFREEYPDMYTVYRTKCLERTLHLGGFMPWEEDGTVIFNLATQTNPGPDASLAAVVSAVEGALAACFSYYDVPELAVPRLGCGIGGLQWENVQYVLRELGEASPVTLTVCSL